MDTNTDIIATVHSEAIPLALQLPHHYSLTELQHELVQLARQITSADAATLWEVYPRGSHALTHLASSKLDPAALPSLTIDRSVAYTGYALDSERIRVIDITNSSLLGRTLQHRHVLESLGICWMISIPIQNTFNRNLPLFAVNLFFRSKPDIALDALYGLARSMAACLEIAILRASQNEAAELQLALGVASRGSEIAICRALAECARNAVRGDTAVVYMEKSDRRSIAAEGVPLDLRSRSAFDTYGSQMKLAAERAWSSGQEDVYGVGSDDSFVINRLSTPLTAVAIPLRSTASQIGGALVVMASGDRHPAARRAHSLTYTDIAIVQAQIQAFLPYHQLYLAERKRTESYERCAHELRTPVTAFGSALEYIENESEQLEERFRHDYFGDIKTWVATMNRVMADVKSIGSRPLTAEDLSVSRAGFAADLVAPSLRFMDSTFKKYSVTKDGVSRSQLSLIPRLYIDKERMSQVVFNLIENAVKYSRRAGDAFSLSIAYHIERGEFYTVVFRDNGKGVTPGYEEVIFARGERGPNAHFADVSGQGLGLDVSRDIVEAHGGRLYCRQPESGPGAEFVLALPKRLANEYPSIEVSDAG